LREKHPCLKHTNPNFLLGVEEELEASLLVIFGNGSGKPAPEEKL
jgi:hypothetical protein